MKKFFLIFLTLVGFNLFAEETFRTQIITDQDAIAFFTEPKYYYYEKYNDVYKLLTNENGTSITISRCTFNNSEGLSFFLWNKINHFFSYLAKDNKIVAIFVEDSKMDLIEQEINDDSDIVDFITKATINRLKANCKTYRDDEHKQNITLKETNGSIIFEIKKDNGKIIKDTLNIATYNKISGNEYFIQFVEDALAFGNIADEKRYKEMYDEIYGYIYKARLDYVKCNTFVTPTNIIASSTLIENNKPENYYGAQNLCDSTYTSWVEGAEDEGINQTITFEFEKPTNIAEIKIANGYGKLRYFFQNNRVKDFEIYTDGKFIEPEPIEVNLWSPRKSYKSFTLRDCWDLQRFNIFATNVTKLTLKIKSVYPGEKFNDTCISEVQFNQTSGRGIPKPYSEDNFLKNIENKFNEKDWYAPKDFVSKELFFAKDAQPLMICTYERTRIIDSYDAYKIDFFIYDFKSNTWIKDNNNPRFAEIKKITDEANLNHYELITGRFDYSLFKLTIYEKCPFDYEFELKENFILTRQR